jgi:hypothetical protein
LIRIGFILRTKLRTGMRGIAQLNSEGQPTAGLDDPDDQYSQKRQNDRQFYETAAVFRPANFA